MKTPTNHPVRFCRLFFSFTLASLILAVSSDPAVAAAIPCGNENATCNLSPHQDSVLVQYGVDNGNSFFFFMDGNSYIHCRAPGSDPAFGVTKKCWYSEMELPFADQDFKPCPGEFQDDGKCGVSWAPQWVRGKLEGGGHTYTMATSWFACQPNNFLGAGSLQGCTYDRGGHVSLLPAPGASPSSQEFPFKVCASEGTNCRIDYPGLVVVAYGAYDGVVPAFNYVLAEVNGNIACNNTTFGDPAPHKKKQCKWAVFGAQEFRAATKGYWKKVAGGTGAIEHKVEYGRKMEKGSAEEESLTKAITVGLEVGVKVKGVTASVTTSATRSYTSKKQFTQSLAKTYGESFGVTCNKYDKDVVTELYQWVVGADWWKTFDEAEGSVYTQTTFCATDVPPGYEGPKCVPPVSNCVGPDRATLCSKCDYKKSP